MNPTGIRTSDNGYQIQTITLAPDGVTRTLRLEIRRLVRLDQWFLSVYDAVTGENLLQYIPLVSSAPDAVNDLLEQFEYKQLGSVVVLPKDTELFGVNPSENTLDKYEVVWGDYLER